MIKKFFTCINENNIFCSIKKYNMFKHIKQNCFNLDITTGKTCVHSYKVVIYDPNKYKFDHF